MSLRDLPIEAIDRSHLDALVDGQEREGKTIEYKVALPGPKRDDKIEFLKDVTSFANTLGGDLIFGVSTGDGIPVDVPGIPTADLDAAQLTFSSLLQNNLDPRLVGLAMQVVPLDGQRSCLVIRIPRSIIGPHVVDHSGHWRFWARNAAGKYELDVGELRRAFGIRDSLKNRVRGFRAERLALIRANDGPVKLVAPSALVLHIVPLSAVEGGFLGLRAGLPNWRDRGGSLPHRRERR